MAASDKEKHQPEKKKKPKPFSNTEILPTVSIHSTCAWCVCLWPNVNKPHNRQRRLTVTWKIGGTKYPPRKRETQRMQTKRQHMGCEEKQIETTHYVGSGRDNSGRKAKKANEESSAYKCDKTTWIERNPKSIHARHTLWNSGRFVDVKNVPERSATKQWLLLSVVCR